jgi:predicted RNase H-like HicB family nuclease
MDMSGKELLKLSKKEGWEEVRIEGSHHIMRKDGKELAMTKVYPAIVRKEDDGYWIEFPDLPGCYTDGDSLEEIMENAEEALGAYLAVKMEYGEEIPKASDINDISSEGIKTYISVDVNKYHKDTKAVKKMLSIPSWLAKEAEDRHYSLSKVLQEALIEKMDLA